MLGHPGSGGVAVVGRGRVLVLGREPVVDRYDDRVAEFGEQLLTGAVVRVDVAEHPAASVEIHHDWQVVALGRVDANRDVAGGTGNRAVLDARGLGSAGLHHGEVRDRRPSFLRGLFGDIGAAGLLQHGE